jgi:hypothetical protein
MPETNHPNTNTATFARMSALMAGVIPPGPNENDKPDGAG